MYYSTPEDKAFWEEITKVSIDSFKGRLKGKWEYRLIENDSGKPHDDIFFEMFKQLYEWWKEGHNVFYVNVDMVCVAPIEIFGKYKYLAMFWHTEAPPEHYSHGHFNCGVLYLPKEIKQEVWDYGFELWEKYWQGERVEWAQDQTIYNEMMFKQDVDPTTFLDNSLHYLAKVPLWNVIPKEEAKIMHYFSTRGRDEALACMREDLINFGRYE